MAMKVTQAVVRGSLLSRAYGKTQWLSSLLPSGPHAEAPCENRRINDCAPDITRPCA